MKRLKTNEKEILRKVQACNERIRDVRLKLETLTRKDEENNLKMLEDKLTQLLTEKTKVELELNEIESMIGV